LIAAFTPILSDIPDDPFHDPPIEAIHRIRGKGAGNKFMLGSPKAKAIEFGEWQEVSSGGLLHVCEGVETALALLVRGVRPIWALGSAGEMENLPVLSYARRLVVWADNDKSGRGLEAAKQLATRWRTAGKAAVIHIKAEVGADYGEA
jgi:hypothetical protein